MEQLNIFENFKYNMSTNTIDCARNDDIPSMYIWIVTIVGCPQVKSNVKYYIISLNQFSVFFIILYTVSAMCLISKAWFWA